jgi:hypothetical protein
MSFKFVWGFDPYEAIQAQRRFQKELGTRESAYNSAEKEAAQIPHDVRSQIDELRRLFGLR